MRRQNFVEWSNSQQGVSCNDVSPILSFLKKVVDLDGYQL